MTHGADEAEFLGDVGEDEVGGGFGEIEELLHAFHVAAAGEAAGADGDERLVDVEAGALGSASGLRKTSMRCAAPGHQEEQGGERRQGGAEAHRTRYFHSMPARMSIMAVTPASTRAVPRSGCLTTRSMKTTGMMAARSRVFFQSRMASRRCGEKPGEKEHEHGLGDLRGLEGEEAAEADPAMGVVRAGEEEDR